MDKQGEMWDKVNRGEKIKLNLGAGDQRYDGYYGVDIRQTIACDCRWDLTKPLPLPDGCATYIHACHIIEHLPGHKIEGIMRDWYRVLADKGILWGFTPNGIEACRRWLKAVRTGNEWLYRLMTNMILGAYSLDINYDETQAHHMIYTKDKLTSLLKTVGFQVCAVEEQEVVRDDPRLAFFGVKGMHPIIKMMEPTYRVDGFVDETKEEGVRAQ